MTTPCTWWKFTGDHTPFDGTGISSAIYVSLETGERRPGNDLPVGALWVIEDDHGYYPKGPDGLSIACRLPGPTTWHIDGRASNCTMPGDKAHRCWVRHGTVGDKLTVDKAGLTCSAGAGSIAAPGYHGFLRDGELT